MKTPPHITPVSTSVQPGMRAALLQQAPHCIWFTGLSGSGKTTLANALDMALHQAGYSTYLLDGDNVRHSLNADLGFGAQARAENIRRIAEVARLMVDAGLVVLVSAISPFAADRAQARALQGELAVGFAPRDFSFTGLALHHYRGGPWEAVGQWSFRKRRRT